MNHTTPSLIYTNISSLTIPNLHKTIFFALEYPCVILWLAQWYSAQLQFLLSSVRVLLYTLKKSYTVAIGYHPCEHGLGGLSQLLHSFLLMQPWPKLTRISRGWRGL